MASGKTFSQEPERPEFRYISNAVRFYARGIANAAMGNVEAARKEQELFEQAAAEIPEGWMIFNNPIGNVLPIARNMLEGEIAYREGNLDKAFGALRSAIEYEDALVYDEPPAWMVPVRHALGALLTESGRYAEAEAVYREDLRRNRGNGWALIGLRECLLAQGQLDESNAVRASLAKAWPRADVSPTSSCYCAPGGQTLSTGRRRLSPLAVQRSTGPAKAGLFYWWHWLPAGQPSFGFIRPVRSGSTTLPTAR